MTQSIKNDQFQNKFSSAKFVPEEDLMCEGFDEGVTANDLEQAYQDYLSLVEFKNMKEELQAC